MQKYVLGFLFDNERDHVVLIRKTKPEWMVGQLNGVGGKVNEHEHKDDAMVREFQEETGVTVVGWEPFATLSAPNYRIHCYKAFSTDAINNVHTTTEEEVEVIPLIKLKLYTLVCSVEWLVPLALDDNAYYTDTEVNK